MLIITYSSRAVSREQLFIQRLLDIVVHTIGGQLKREGFFGFFICFKN